MINHHTCMPKECIFIGMMGLEKEKGETRGFRSNATQGPTWSTFNSLGTFTAKC